MKGLILVVAGALSVAACASTQPTTVAPRNVVPLDPIYWKRCMAFMERSAIGALRKQNGKQTAPTWESDVAAAEDCTRGPTEQFFTQEQRYRFAEAVRMYRLAMETPSASTVAEFVRAETFFNSSLNDPF